MDLTESQSVKDLNKDMETSQMLKGLDIADFPEAAAQVESPTEKSKVPNATGHNIRILYHPSASVWVIVQANKMDFIEFVTGDLEGDRNFS